jgi:two-component system chemotaxis response regulator CheB
MIRVLVVDDSAFVRQALTRMLTTEDIEVVGAAVDGQDGVEKCLLHRPDVVTLDVKMPRLGGLDALKRIMEECPTAVLLLSSQTSEGAETTLRGLELGAMDFVDKSSVQGHMNLLSLAEDLRAKVRALASVPREKLGALRAPAPMAQAAPHVREAEVVVIGTSTGGPPALQAIIPRLPGDLPSPVLVVQHMPVGFTKSLADRLDGRSALKVKEAEDGETIHAGVVYIAPAGRHMKVKRRGTQVRVWLDDEPKGALHRPAVDVLMTSVARVYGSRALGVLLTGMGADGVEGMRALKEAGSRTMAESEETSIIYGMPKAAVEAGVVDRSIPLYRMADEILAAV